MIIEEDDLTTSEEMGSKASSNFVLVVTEKGFGKRVLISAFKTQRRGGKGVIMTKFKEKAGGGGKASRDKGRSKKDSDAVACMRVRIITLFHYLWVLIGTLFWS